MTNKLRPVNARRYARALRRIFTESDGPEQGQHPPRANKPGDFKVREQPLTRQRIAELVGPEADFWWINDNDAGLLRLCSSVEGSGAVLTALLRVADRESLAVELRHRQTNDLLGSSTREALSHLGNEHFIRLVLHDMRSGYPPIAVSVEAWNETSEGHLSSPSNNALISRIWRSTAADRRPIRGAVDANEFLEGMASDRVPFEIDWVFSWVDSSDLTWQEMFAQWAPETTNDASEPSRYLARDDLKFALRSLDLFAPWVRRIHVITNCRPPLWLDVDHPKIHWVDHSEVFDADKLPTFSSHAIETVVHRIPGLSEHFVYSNDDFFLARPAEPSDFFHSNGIARLRLEPFGMVNGRATEGDPDYLNAARNSAALLQRDFGHVPVRLHTHSPQSMNRLVLEEMEERYRVDFERTRNNKFRAVSDVAVTGFLYHHYAFATGRAVPDGAQTLLIQQNHQFARVFSQQLLAQDVGLRSRYQSFCINDGNGSNANKNWNMRSRAFLQSYFQYSSDWER